MRNNIKQLKYLLLIAIATGFICAVSPVKNTLSKDYTVTINGTSNLHDWNEKVTSVYGDDIVYWNPDGTFDLEAITIKMQVRSIQSDMGSVMNNNTYKALKADANPEIIFTLTNEVKAIPTKGDEATIIAKGNLTIAGVTRPVDMKVKINMLGNGKLQFIGSQNIKMTDFGVTPPVALFGTLKTGDEITINFKINLQ